MKIHILVYSGTTDFNGAINSYYCSRSHICVAFTKTMRHANVVVKRDAENQLRGKLRIY
jgi:hypothetical protein